MPNNATTASWQPPTPEARGPRGRLVLLLVGSLHEPERLGELAVLPAHPEVETTLGRHGSLEWGRQRPGSWSPMGSLADPQLSREQLRLTYSDGQPIVQNVGRLPLTLNGQPVDQCPVAQGDLLMLGDRVLLWVTRRPVSMPGEMVDEPPWGCADDLGLVGESPVAWELRRQIGFVARRNVHVLVLGESGTGKELVANGLHALSPRHRRAIVSRNAATIPDSLADAELFGNLAGYPNPGTPGRPGLVGEADRSTLFLDEFGELPVEQQARLLRVLDSGEYTRLGEARPRTADLRLVAATNRDPEQLKHDVLARLQIRIAVPPLRDRIEDVPQLAVHLLRRICRDDRELASQFFPEGPSGRPQIAMRLMVRWLTHRYTTHVRELQSLIWQAIAASDGPLLDLSPSTPLPTPAPATNARGGPVDPSLLDPEVIQNALDRHGGRQEPVWRELGLTSRHVLARLVKKHGLTVRGRS